MPLFAKKNRATPVQYDAPPPRTSLSSGGASPKRGFFNRRRSSTSSLSSSDFEDDRRRPSKFGNMFHRNEDPSVKAARRHVNAAEGAEKDADRAAGRAKMSVFDARKHVKNLEKEADAEARRAKMKQTQARDLNKRTKPLGRKFY